MALTKPPRRPASVLATAVDDEREAEAESNSGERVVRSARKLRGCDRDGHGGPSIPAPVEKNGSLHSIRFPMTEFGAHGRADCKELERLELVEIRGRLFQASFPSTTTRPRLISRRFASTETLTRRFISLTGHPAKNDDHDGRGNAQSDPSSIYPSPVTGLTRFSETNDTGGPVVRIQHFSGIRTAVTDQSTPSGIQHAAGPKR
jgi:hypothetical protein